MERKKKRNNKKPMPFMGKIIIFMLSVVSIYGARSFASDFIGNDNNGHAFANSIIAQRNDTANNPSTPGINNPTNPPVITEHFTAIHISEITDTRYLELVNHEYGLSNEPDENLIDDAHPTVAVRTRDITLHISARTAVSGLFEAARNDSSIGTFFVSSGFRDIATQEQLYNSGMDRTLVLPPGHSEHHTGLGIDILALDIGQFELGNAPKGRWLVNNSWKFGLILRYPEDKQDVTGIAYEPWHFRYIGQPHAWYMWENDMVFEEYIEFLRNTGGYTAVYNGQKYTVLYQEPVNGMLHIPDNTEFTVSSDNTGGYIITAW
jgi:D-alanyl-D-alanine carboxypeptidase